MKLNFWLRATVFLALAVWAGCQLDPGGAGEEPPSAEAARQAVPQAAPQVATAPENRLVILNESQLPDTYPQARYEVLLAARGGVPPLHWRRERGVLPPGLNLEDNGLLHGFLLRGGEFQFVVSVMDSGKPQQAVEKPFLIRVRAAMTLDWKTHAHVSGNRIEGTAEVSNTSPDDIDLTFIVLAVADNGRATAIGYQHFTLARGTQGKVLPFGETLPSGGYVVHVDAVGEVPAKGLIYRERLQTPGELQVTAGP